VARRVAGHLTGLIDHILDYLASLILGNGAAIPNVMIVNQHTVDTGDAIATTHTTLALALATTGAIATTTTAALTLTLTLALTLALTLTLTLALTLALTLTLALLLAFLAAVDWHRLAALATFGLLGHLLAKDLINLFGGGLMIETFTLLRHVDARSFTDLGAFVIELRNVRQILDPRSILRSVDDHITSDVVDLRFEGRTSGDVESHHVFDLVLDNRHQLVNLALDLIGGAAGAEVPNEVGVPETFDGTTVDHPNTHRVEA